MFENHNYKNRYIWIDWAKSVGMFLVILGHEGLSSGVVKNFIYSFHMPLFFIISGVLYKHRNLRETILKDYYRLLIPYFMINALLFGYNIYSGYCGRIIDSEFILSRIFAIILGVGYNTDCFHPVCLSGWFIIALIIIHLFASIQFCRNSLVGSMLGGVFVASVALLLLFDIRTYIPIDCAIIAYPFFVIGVILKEQVLAYDSINSFVLGTLMLLGCFFISLYNGRVDIDTINTGHHILLFYINGLLGSFGIISICKCIKNSNTIIHTISIGSIIIIGFNMLTIDYLKMLFYKIFNLNNFDGFVGFFLATIIFLLFVPLIQICRKWIPSILGIISNK